MSASSKAKKHSKSSTKSGSKPQGNSEWGDWIWDQSWQCEVRSRQKADGEWEYQFPHPEDNKKPRTPAVALPEDEGENTSQPDDELSPLGSPGYVAYAPQLTRSFSASGSQLPEGLSTEGYSPSVGSRGGRGSASMSSSISFVTQQFSRLNTDLSGPGYGTIDPGVAVPQQNMMDRPDIPPNEGGFQRIYQQPGVYGTRSYATSSYGQNTFAGKQPLSNPVYGRLTQSPPILGNPASNTFSTLDPSTPPYQAFPTQEEPRQFHASRKPEGSEHITPTAGAITRAGLHKDFKVHHSNEFSFGRVFKILWAEPSGEVPNGGNYMGTERIATKHGEQAYATIRRFVIVRPRDGHCLCLPILTYGRKATKKPGVKPQDHAIVYIDNSKKPKKGEKSKKSEKKTKPTEVEGEDKLSKKPIGIKPSSLRDQLDRHSRLNYAKIYTVEHNLKVCFIGSIHRDSIKYFKRDFNATHAPLPQEPGTEFSDDDEEEEEEDIEGEGEGEVDGEGYGYGEEGEQRS